VGLDKQTLSSFVIITIRKFKKKNVCYETQVTMSSHKGSPCSSKRYKLVKIFVAKM
jgi:hypothetical protein